MKPEVVELNADAMDSLRERVQANALDAADRQLLDQIMGSYAYVSALLREKNITIKRLRNEIFGPKSESAKDLFPEDPSDTPDPKEEPADTIPAASESDVPSAHHPPIPDLPDTPPPSTSSTTGPATKDFPHDEPPQVTKKKRRKGHGRNGADTYRGASVRKVALEDWKSGDPCPECEEGILYQKPPNVIVRLVGQSPLQATVYQLEKLRCHLCGYTIVAPPPEGVGEQKYDESARAMIALLRYGLGLPLNRQRRLQAILGNPLPVSTQWDLLSELADCCAPAYATLEDRAAQGELYFTDDTGVKILSLMNRESKQQALEEDDVESNRTGLFTTGIVVDWQRYRIVLFNSDRRHAGETLLDLLQKRQDGLDPPLHMCDALSRNMPAELETIIANCLAHARRKFVEVRDYFEKECRHVIDILSVIYQNDATTRAQNMTADERLHYHQVHSGPAMKQLHAWLTAQLSDRSTEPNSSLGKAIKYMLRNWERLTLFLQRAGAPLDNNVCERALKRAIIHRKNSLFYKTLNGARVGDMLMSLIYTAEINRVNPLDYLIALQQHASDVEKSPDAWLPWNYQDAIASRSPTTEPLECQALPL